MDDHFVPANAGTPICPVCHEQLVFEVYPGYEHNEWRSYCASRSAQCSAVGLISVDSARIAPIEEIWTQ